ncbi:MAG: ATP-binding protein [Rhodospirillales bacterium]|nr:ATP-binding protein [Rhodospirillales bacterium]
MHLIADNDLFHRLAFDNPWWEFKAETKIKFRRPARRVFFPAFFDRIMKAGPGEVLLLAGPLRAGKTVLMRQMVAHLIEHGVSPRAIFYASITTPSYTAADLGTLFEMFCRRYRHGPNAELYVFFDEIQYAKDWEQAILSLANRRPRSRFVGALSSGTPAITSGRKLHDGRLSIFVLPPLTFLEFLRFRGSEEQLFTQEPGKTTGKMVLRPGALAALNTEFYRYVNFGGFLEGVLGKAEGAPAPTFIRDGVADRVLHKDTASLAGISDTQELNHLFSLLAFNTGREVSIEELAGAAGIAKNTLRKYLDYLEAAFLIRRIARVDKNGMRFQRAVAFKIYLTSPCLYAALYAPVAATDQYFQRLAETALVSQWLGSEAIDDLAYASWRDGHVDLLSIDPATQKPDHVYEVDWNDSYGTPEKKPSELVQFVEGTNAKAASYILTRSIARPGVMRGIPITLAPLSLYCYWLDRDPTVRRFHARGEEQAALGAGVGF